MMENKLFNSSVSCFLQYKIQVNTYYTNRILVGRPIHVLLGV